MKKLIKDALIIGMSAGYLWTFAMIAIKGKVFIQEPCFPILFLEYVGMLLILLFGIDWFIKDAK